MPLKILENRKIKTIILYAVIIALLITSAILISMIIDYYGSLDDTGGGN